jgi:transposase-like protein
MTTADVKVKRERVVHSAREKAQAVLAGWTERRRPCEICREMKITSSVLSQWQERAMEGILAALEPQKRLAPGQKPSLPAKVERLLARKSSPETPTRLARRLAALGPAKEVEKPPVSGAPH